MTKRSRVLLGVAVILLVAAAVVRSGTTGTAALWAASNEGRWLLPLVLAAALIDSVNPCAFAVLLLTIAFLLSIGRLRGELLRIGGWYVAGIGVVYLLIGLGLLQALHLFNTPHFMGRLAAAFLVLLGLLQVANALIPNFPIRIRIPHVAHHRIADLMRRATAPAAFALGALVGLCEFPCTGGPYLMVLGLLHDRATYLRGVGYLVLYNAIFILPLVVTLVLASTPTVVERLQAWHQSDRRWVRLAGGVMMIALALLTFAL